MPTRSHFGAEETFHRYPNHMLFLLFIGIGLLSCAFVPATSAQQVATTAPYEEDERTTAMRTQAKASDRLTHFRGKVVDLDDKPVVGAKVCLIWTHYNTNVLKESSRDPTAFLASDMLVVETEADGQFDVGERRGWRFTIRAVIKTGYEFAPRWNPDLSFDKSPRSPLTLLLTDDNKPIVLRLRKKGPETCLWYHKGERDVNPTSLLRGPFLKRVRVGLASIAHNNEPYVPFYDLEMEVKSRGKEEGCRVVATTPDHYGGVILSDKWMSEAPADGYQPKVTFDVKSQDGQSGTTKYLYVKMGEPVLYARFELKCTASRDQLKIANEVWINLLGERNLEPDEDLKQSPFTKGILTKASESLQAGRLPKKNDLEPIAKRAREAVQKRRNEYLELMRSANKPIEFVGKVMDESGQPVEGVEIGARLEYCAETDSPLTPRRQKALRTHTDSEGVFRFDDLVGSTLYLKVIRKRGYEFTRNDHLDKMSYPNRGGRARASDKDVPVAFHIRKRGDTTFLYPVYGRPGLVLKPPSTTAYMDFYASQRTCTTEWPLPQSTSRRDEFHPDLIIKGEYRESAKRWELFFKAPTEQDGVFLTDKLLFEAPNDGFVTEQKLFHDPSNQMEQKNYLYVRSRTPGIYTRLEIEVHNYQDNLRLSCKGHSNPYGERILEEHPNLTPAVSVQLMQEAGKTIRKGQRSPKPDLAKLIQEDLKKSETKPLPVAPRNR